tara:strand:+ start:3015 stop:6038 length:3024 start_codon:yes stop_codon:yes gene_type:complete
MSRLLTIALRGAVAVFLPFGLACGDETLDGLKPFLKQHCYECHGAEKQKNDIRLDTLGTDLSETRILEIWQEVLDQLNLGEMPPKKKPQPPRAEVGKVVDVLTARLKVAYAKQKSTGGQTVLRRLNRYELRNTFRDLLYLKGAEYSPDAAGSRLIDNNGNGSVERTGNDPLRFFPEDEEEDGFFNLGDKLVMSDFLLKLTLGAVEEVLAQATRLEPKPNVEKRSFAGHLIEGKGQGEHPIEAVSREFNPGFDMMAKGYERYGRVSPTKLRQGVGVAARYRITIEASAHNGVHPYGEMIHFDPAKGFQLCLNIANTGNGGIAGPTSTPVAIWSLPDDGKKRSFTHEVWMDKRWVPWIGWENGPDDRTYRAEKMVEKFLPDAYFARPDKKLDKPGHDQWQFNLAKLLVKDGYKGPHLRIYSLTVEPLLDAWPPQSHTALYGSGIGEEKEIRQLMTTFAERAFRRPVAPELIEPYVQLVLKQKVEPVVILPGGIKNLKYQAYEGQWEKLPEFDKLKPFAQGDLPNGLIDLRVSKKKEKYGMVFTGNVEAPKTGDYVFEIASDDGGRLMVDGKIVVEHDGLHGAQLKKGSVKLEAGKHDIRVEYFAYGQPNSFRAGWGGAGMAHAQLSVDSLRDPNKNTKKPDNEVPLLVRAMQDGYSAILCSPQFLYLHEKSGRLDAFEIASRLSYFLWSSMPDEELFASARSGKLNDPKERSRQVERMLKDVKAEAFVRHFPSAWLRLDKLGDMPPSGGDLQFYKNVKIEPMLAKQVTTYFGDILKTNGRIEQFIDSDYTYMNQTLAKWIYRREGIRGERLRKVKLDDPRRGGIFTQPGLMTATANGVDTSPVIRGVWVLENILGTPPSPPPPDVEPLPTDTREATTIREQLALHRKNDACYSCHVKIDPMGFAFENFDVVGRWRDRYKRAKGNIDTSATMANGDEIADIVAFKKMLMERKHLIVRCLTKKMLTYATGRHLEAVDRGEIDRITTELSKKDDRLRDLIHLVVQSDIFLSK